VKNTKKIGAAKSEKKSAIVLLKVPTQWLALHTELTGLIALSMNLNIGAVEKCHGRD